MASPAVEPSRDALGFDAADENGDSGGESKTRKHTAASAKEDGAPPRKRVELKYGGGRRKPPAGDAELRALRAYYSDVVDRHSLTLLRSS